MKTIFDLERDKYGWVDEKEFKALCTANRLKAFSDENRKLRSYVDGFATFPNRGPFSEDFYEILKPEDNFLDSRTYSVLNDVLGNVDTARFVLKMGRKYGPKIASKALSDGIQQYVIHALKRASRFKKAVPKGYVDSLINLLFKQGWIEFVSKSGKVCLENLADEMKKITLKMTKTSLYTVISKVKVPSIVSLGASIAFHCAADYVISYLSRKQMENDYDDFVASMSFEVFPLIGSYGQYLCNLRMRPVLFQTTTTQASCLITDYNKLCSITIVFVPMTNEGLVDVSRPPLISTMDETVQLERKKYRVLVPFSDTCLCKDLDLRDVSQLTQAVPRYINGVSIVTPEVKFERLSSNNKYKTIDRLKMTLDVVDWIISCVPM